MCTAALAAVAACGLDVHGLELAGLELARELRVQLGVPGWRFPGREAGAAHLELAEAPELEDLQHEHEVDARSHRAEPEHRQHRAPAEVEVAVVVGVRHE